MFFKVFILTSIALFVILFFSSKKLEDNNYEIVKQLGTEEFTKEKWAKASQENRGKLLYSFLQKYKLQTLTKKDIIDLLGKPTGYYDYDVIPAYFIGSKKIQSMYGNGYLIAFHIDLNGKSDKIIEMIIEPSLF